MKKLVILLVFVLTALALVSCGGEATPDGMQICYANASEGYNFYVPDGWVISNTNNIRSAYASRIDTSSVSFAEVKPEKPEALGITLEDYFFGSYFEEQKSEFPSEPEITVHGENANFGKKDYRADKAIKYIFNHEYDNHKFTTMQILVSANSRYYIFTYTALNEERSEGETYYSFHLAEIQKCIEEFMFIEIEASEDDVPDYESDSDGFLLYSDSSLAGFSLYVSPDFALDYSSAIVSATHEDGSNITMTEATSTGGTAKQYWEMRKAELSAIVSELTVIKEDSECTFGNRNKYSFEYEYTYRYNGKTFHVYQVLAVHGMNGYVFTYTANEENYGIHIDKINSVCDKVVFK
jgi:hypothetical protein